MVADSVNTSHDVELMDFMFEDEPEQAFEAFVLGLGRLSEEGKDVHSMLEDLGLGAILTSSGLLRLAVSEHAAEEGAMTLSKSLDVAAHASDEGGALAREAAKRWETFASQIRSFTNYIKELVIF